jgi:hypothetical protein
MQYNSCNGVHSNSPINATKKSLEALTFTVPTVHQHMLLARVANLTGNVGSAEKHDVSPHFTNLGTVRFLCRALHTILLLLLLLSLLVLRQIFSDCGSLDCDTVKSSKQISEFRKNVLLLACNFKNFFNYTGGFR